MLAQNWFQDPPFPLLSVEMHYFRVPRAHWEKMLWRLRQMGANTVSSYVMWGWHEPAEGQFDFTGQTTPERDLTGFIRLAGEMGFRLLLKPGPFIDADTLGGGIPCWLIEKIPQAYALRQDGQVWRHSSSKQPRLSYLHPMALEQAQRWFSAFSQVALPYQWPQGPVIALQVDNETPGDGFIAGDQDDPAFDYHFRSDYNPIYIQSLWPQWLETRYGSVRNLSLAYDISVTDYTQVALPANWTEPASRGELRRWMDLARFNDWIYNRVLRFYTRMLQETGWQIPFFHNLLSMPWEASGVPASMGATASAVGWLGQTVHPQSIRQPFIYVNGQRMGFEEYIQYAIWRSRLVKNYSPAFPSFAPEISAAGDFPLQSLVAGGVEAVNIYSAIESNQEPAQVGACPHWGAEAPIRPDGSLQKRFWNVKTLFDFLAAGGKNFAQSHLPADITLAYTHNAELAWQWFFSPDYYGRHTGRQGSDPIADQIAPILNGADTAVRSQAIAGQLMRMQIDFDVLDIDFARPEQLDPKRLLILPASAIMARRTQENLAEFLRQGGGMIWIGGESGQFAEFPEFDENLLPCQALKQAAQDLDRVWKMEANLPTNLADQIFKAGYLPRYAWSDAAEAVDVTVRHGAEQMNFLGIANRSNQTYEGTITYQDENHQIGSIQARLAGPHASFIALRAGQLESAILYGYEGGAYLQSGSERFAVDRGQAGLACIGASLLVSAPETINVYILRQGGWNNIRVWRLLLNGQVEPAEARIVENLLALAYQPEVNGREAAAVLICPASEPLAPGLRPYFDTALNFFRLTLAEVNHHALAFQSRLSSTGSSTPALSSRSRLPEVLSLVEQTIAQAISQLHLPIDEMLPIETYQQQLEQVHLSIGPCLEALTDVLRQTRIEIAAGQAPASEAWIDDELWQILDGLEIFSE